MSTATYQHHRPSYARSSSSSSSSSSSENLPPRTLARLAREVRDLFKNPPEGIRLHVDSDSGLPSNLGELVAELAGPQGTPYEGKFFNLKLVFSQDFPSAPPRGFFLTKIYHPNVDMSTGAICVNTLKKDWTPQTTLLHVLAVIRCLLIVPFPESSLNDEAGKLFMESYTEYNKRARLMADVHGQPYSSCAANEDAPNSKKAKASSDTDEKALICKDSSSEKNINSSSTIVTASNRSSSHRVLKNSTDNPLRSNSNNHTTTKTLTKGASGKLKKKKSLRRL